MFWLEPIQKRKIRSNSQKFKKVTSYQIFEITYSFGIKLGERIENLYRSVFLHIVRLRIGNSSCKQREELTSRTSDFSNTLRNLFFSYCLQPD